MTKEEDDRTRSLELLRAGHVFPGPFQFRIVVLPGREADAITAVRTAIGTEDAIEDVSTRASRNGRFVSVRATAKVPRAEAVLAVYAFLKDVEGVVTVF